MPQHPRLIKGPIFKNHPFNDIPQGLLRQAFIDLGHEAAAEFPNTKEEVCSLFRQYDPFLTVAKLAAHALSVGITHTGHMPRRENPSKPQQAHVELAQALLLTVRKEELSAIPIPDGKFQKIWDGLIKLGNNFSQARYASLAHADDEEQRNTRLIVEHLRVHTQYVRNWGHFSHVVEILRTLYSGVEGVFTAKYGVSAAKIVGLFVSMIEQIETAQTDIMKKLRQTFKANTKREMINAYHRNFPDLESNASEFYNFVRENKIGRQHLMALFVGHSDLRRVEYATFHINDLASRLQCDPSRAKPLLDQFSMSIEALKDMNFDHLFLGNPVWYKPLIRLSEREYFCPLPQLFFSFSPASIENLFAGDPEAAKAISRQRGRFLEKVITDLFEAKFSDAKITRNFKWKASGKEYETDLIILLDLQLFIVEAKSGKVTDIALRGGIERVKTHLKELVLEPALQADRLFNYISILRSGATLPPDVEVNLPIDLSLIHRVTKLSVTLEEFAIIQGNARELRVAELLEKDLPEALGLTLASLKTIFEMIDSPAEAAHYLIRRCEIQNSIRYFGDENDMLGYYLTSGMNFGSLELGQERVMLNHMSIVVDNYYTAIDNGIALQKPKRPMTNWFSDMADYLTSRRRPGWTELAYILYCVQYEDQVCLEQGIKGIIKKLKQQKRSTKDQIDTVIYSPPPWSKTGIAVTALFENDKQARHERMSNAASQAFEASEAEICAVIAVDVDGVDYPYTTYGLYFRSTEH